jgi:hypothetical protein
MFRAQIELLGSESRENAFFLLFLERIDILERNKLLLC